MSQATDTWSALSKSTAQVLICDLQKQIAARSKTTPPKALAGSARVLAQLADLFKLPLTLSVVPEENEPPQLIPELQPFARENNQFLRANASPILDDKTRTHLHTTGRKIIILSGFAIEVVVLHAALQAIQQGFLVIVAIDACGGMSQTTESAAIEHMRKSGALISSVVSIGTALSPDFTSDEGQRMFSLVQALRLA